MSEPISIGARLWLAFVCFFRVIFDGRLAARVLAATTDAPELPPADEPEREAPRSPPEADRALRLLALLQREGRLVDFLQQDVSSFEDADIGAAARVVHDGCRRALLRCAEIATVRDEDEGTTVSVEAGFDPVSVKLTGNVSGSAPYRGVLRHRGWRAASLELPEVVGEHDVSVLAPAEVEL